MWPEMGPPLLIYFSAWLSSPPSHPEVLNLGLPLSVAVLLSSMGVLCDLVFSHSESAHMLLSLGHVFSLHCQSFLYALNRFSVPCP